MSPTSLLISLFLIPLITSQNIITSFDYDKTLTYTLQDVQTMLNTNLLVKLQSLLIPDFSDGSVKLSSIKPSSVSATLTSSYGNMQTQLYLFSPSKLSITFTLNYTTSSSSGSCEIEFSVFDLRSRFTVASSKPAVTVVIETRVKDYVVFNVDSAEIATQIQNVMYTQMNQQNIISQIANEIEKGINTYYEELYTKKDKFIFTSSSLFGNNAVNITFNTFIAFPEDFGKKYKSAVMSYAGNVEGKEVSGNKTSKAFANKDFVNPGDDYFTFINYDLFNDVFDTLVTKGIEMTFNKNSIPNLSFELTFNTLSQVFSGLPSSFNSTDEVVIVSKLEKILFLAQGKGEFNLTSGFKVKNSETVVELAMQVEFEAPAVLKKTTLFDLCLNKYTIKSKRVVTEGISISNQETLDKYINEIFTYGMGLPTCLSDNGITLRDYYRYINKVMSEENGVYIQGKHIYF